jgi:hypothetical protein
MEQVMERTKAKTLMTAEELLRLPDDGLCYELEKEITDACLLKSFLSQSSSR